jgi:cation diffusion facilitator CzcD-associated flavoprotein CzcO
MTTLDAVIVGGGQAGLAVSYFLQQSKINYVVFEQARTGETWPSARSKYANVMKWVNQKRTTQSASSAVCESFCFRCTIKHRQEKSQVTVTWHLTWEHQIDLGFHFHSKP